MASGQRWVVWVHFSTGIVVVVLLIPLVDSVSMTSPYVSPLVVAASSRSVAESTSGSKVRPPCTSLS
jgi:hypothetical protein